MGRGQARPGSGCPSRIPLPARGRADSDIDILLLTNEVRSYLDDPSWIESFGEIDRTQQEVWGDVHSLRVWYQDGREVEFAIADPAWARVPMENGTRQAIEGGMRILIDRTGRLSWLG